MLRILYIVHHRRKKFLWNFHVKNLLEKASYYKKKEVWFLTSQIFQIYICIIWYKKHFVPDIDWCLI